MYGSSDGDRWGMLLLRKTQGGLCAKISAMQHHKGRSTGKNREGKERKLILVVELSKAKLFLWRPNGFLVILLLAGLGAGRLQSLALWSPVALVLNLVSADGSLQLL